jgi:predicted PurR-regulated permease PerM
VNKLYKNLLIIGGALLAGFLAWYFSSIVAYLLISAVLALVGKPVVNFLGKITIKNHTLPRWLCAASSLIVIMLIFCAFFYFLVPMIASEVKAFTRMDVNEFVTLLSNPLQKLENLLNSLFVNTNFSFKSVMHKQIESIFDSSVLIDSFGSITDFVVSIGIAVFAIIFITFFFLKEESLFIDGVVILFPEQYDSGIRHAWNNATKLLVRYFIGVFVDMLCIMTVLTIGLYFIVGLNFGTALLLGLTAGILNVIPYVGPLIAAGISLVISMAANIGLMYTTEYLTVVVKILLVFIGMKILDDAVFQPFIFANSIRAHPLEIFLLILIAGKFAGIGGMLIAIPTYTVLRVFAKEFFNRFRVVQKLTNKI